ncbi:MAG: HAD hydrolase-like protein [Acidimicrobiia bacterium]|nr:HAD hydrolase-like protein [Acidimicrobiia bacterium]
MTEPPGGPPAAVLLDVGGIFLLPDHGRIVSAYRRAEIEVAADLLDHAHYRAAAEFSVDVDVDADWRGSWQRYLDAYVAACGVPAARRDDAHQHLDSEFADAALWSTVVESARLGLAALASTGVALGIISNADGMMDARLREAEILQVGPGGGIEVGCLIDSGSVGVMKPDPRIFELGLTALDIAAADTWYLGDMPAFDVVGARRAGIRPFLMDPLDLHLEQDYDRVGSLLELADRIRGGNA